MTIENPQSVTLVAASDANYFFLLRQLVESIGADPVASTLSLSILDLGLDPEQQDWLKDRGATLAKAEWDIETPWRDKIPDHFLGMLCRPFFPKYFPGYEVYISIDADTWIQDGRVLEYYVNGARDGKLAIVPEMDRSYFTCYKRPKLFGWGENFKAMKWAFGFKKANKVAGRPICNAGIFALKGDAPHWKQYELALTEALNRKRFSFDLNAGGWLVEQASLNYIIYNEKMPTTFLPAYCNWFCALASPVYDAASGQLLEPNQPMRPLGILHLAGKGIKDKDFNLNVLNGDNTSITTKLTYDAIKVLKS